MTLQEIFNKLLERETLVLDHFSKRDYDSTVVMVRRKFRNYCKLFSDIGAPNPYEGHYVKITWNPETCQGTYSIALTDERQNAPKSYRTADL